MQVRTQSYANQFFDFIFQGNIAIRDTQRAFGIPSFCHHENKKYYGLVGISFMEFSSILFVNVLTLRDWIQSVISGDQDDWWPTSENSERLSNKASCTLEPSFFIIWTYFMFMYKN